MHRTRALCRFGHSFHLSGKTSFIRRAMRPFGLFLAVIGLWPGTMAMTSHEFLQMHKRTFDNLAPLYRLDDSSSTNSSGAAIPHEYIVMFRPGWTHEQHWAAVGGKDTVVDSRDPRFQKASFGYRALLRA